MSGPAQPPAKQSAFMRALDTPIHPSRLFGSGIIWREICASASAVMALAGFFALYILLGKIRDLIGDVTNRSISRAFGTPAESVWLGLAIIMAFLLGTLCGAEEEENGTADFVFRLPIPRWRILAEKLCGSGIAFLCWVVLSAFLFFAIRAAFGDYWFESHPQPFGLIYLYDVRQIYWDPHMLQTLAVWAPLLYCFGLAAGAWIGKVVLAAVVGGCSAAVFGWFISYLANHRLFALHVVDSYWWTVILLGCLLALAAAGLRHHFREGR
jgi:hypothetical protein